MDSYYCEYVVLSLDKVISYSSKILNLNLISSNKMIRACLRIHSSNPPVKKKHYKIIYIIIIALHKRTPTNEANNYIKP